MKIKGVSFSGFVVKVDIYDFEKLSLFEFLFAKIILDESLNKDLKVVDCLLSLDIKEDLLYLFNNVYYEFVDNKILEETKEDIYDLKIKDIKINARFVKHLKNGYMPLLKESVSKDFIYDYLKNKIVISDLNYEDSNIVLVRVNNDFLSVEELINNNIESLFNIKEGECILKELKVNPYYFEINLKEKDDKYYCENNISKDIKYNSLYLNDKELKGDVLTNNIRFKCVYGKEILKDYSDYVFVNDKNKEFEVNNNIIYVNFILDEGDFIDLVKKEVYQCGVYSLNEDKVSTYICNKSKKISDFKLYLTKNKEKFNVNIKNIIDLI